MVAREPCASHGEIAERSPQPGEYWLQDFFIEWNSDFRNLLYAHGRRTDPSGHNECICVGSRTQPKAGIGSARQMGNCDMARGRNVLHASAGRLARSTPLVPIITRWTLPSRISSACSLPSDREFAARASYQIKRPRVARSQLHPGTKALGQRL